MALGNEIAKYGLFEQGWMVLPHGFSRGKHLHHFRGNHHIAKAQRGKEHSAETSGKNDGRGAIETLQGGHGPAGVAIFAVVIVLKNDASRTASPFKQSQSAPQAHGDAER